MTKETQLEGEKMKATRSLLLALLAILVVLWVPGAAHAKSGGAVLVTTTVYDTDSNGIATLLHSDDYNAQGQATYTNNNSVVSGIYSGVLQVDLFNQTLRTFFITPNDAYSAAQNPPVPIPPAGYYYQNVEMVVHCYDQNLNVVYLQNITTSSSNCQLGIDFGYGGVKYKLVIGPALPAPGPATGTVTVNCNAISAGQCINWTIAPTPNGGLANVANLYYWPPHKSLVYIGGQYFNTFRITASNP